MIAHDSGLERGSKSLVVVDDSDDMAVPVLLELERCIACVALTGAAWIDLVARSRANAVLHDYMLPDVTGADVAMALGDDRARPATSAGNADRIDLRGSRIAFRVPRIADDAFTLLGHRA